MAASQGSPVDDWGGAGGASHRRELLLHVAAAAGSLLLCGWFYRLWDARLEIPLQYTDRNDAPFGYALVKTIIETGWFQENPRLSAPGSLQLYDFPFGEHLHMVLLRLIGAFAGDYGLTVNLFYLATFPLVACSSLFAMRRLGVDGRLAVAGSLLFAFLPFHFLRGQCHLFYSAYFAVPPTALMLIGLYRGRALLFRDRPGSWRPALAAPGRFAVVAGAACVLSAYSGVYFAFFGALLCGVAGLAALLARRSVAGLLNAWAAGGLIGLLLLVGLIPNALYWREHGKNPAAVPRSIDEFPPLSLTLRDVVKPYPYHPLRELKWVVKPGRPTPLPDPSHYLVVHAWNEQVAYPGLAGLLGLAILLGVLFLPAAPRGPLADLGPISRLSLAILLIGMPYGFGHLFGELVTLKIRAYNRMSVYLAYFAILALVLVVDRLLKRSDGNRRRRLGSGAAIALCTGFFLFEQMPPALRPVHAELAAEYDAHREFYGVIEGSLPRGSMVYQLPYATFPEGWIKPSHSPFLYRSYRDLRAYLHTDDLLWSGGAIYGREADRWRAAVASEPVDAMLGSLREAEFAGLTVDRDGYEDHGAAIEQELREELGLEPLVSRDGRLLFFPIDQGATVGDGPA